jgi:hypothetical protein
MISHPGRETTFYHPRLQTSAFDLPLWAEKRIYGFSVLDADQAPGASSSA